MSSKQTVSVIIPNYNYGRFIGEAIESALAQTYPPLEIIVVDDGSTDDSVKIVESFGDKVKLITLQNGGVGKARNIGAANASGKLLAFLDADDIWLPEKSERQIGLFSEDTVGYVSCGMREFSKDDETLNYYVPSVNGWTTEDMILFSIPIVVSGSAFMVKKDVFDHIGGFDENPDLHPSEDWDFARQVLEVSVIRAVSDILVDYRNHGNNGHLKIPRFERSMLLAFDKTFKNNSPEIQKLKNKAYGNLHKILAGSFYQAGNAKKFAAHSLKSLQKNPANILYFAEFPIRKFRRKSA